MIRQCYKFSAKSLFNSIIINHKSYACHNTLLSYNAILLILCSHHLAWLYLQINDPLICEKGVYPCSDDRSISQEHRKEVIW